jgi:hypothetical protein
MNKDIKEISGDDIRTAFSLSKETFLIIDLRSDEEKAKYVHKTDPISLYVSSGIGIANQNILIKY